MLDIGLDLLASIVGALCCCQCPAALISLLCSMARTQNKKSNHIAVCSKAYVMGIHDIMDAIGVSIAAKL